MLYILLGAIAIAAVILAAAALALLARFGRICDALRLDHGKLISEDEYERLLIAAQARPPNKPKPQAHADGYRAPLVRKAHEQLIKRRGEAANG